MLEGTFCQWALQGHVYCIYKQPSSKTKKKVLQFAVWNFYSIALVYSSDVTFDICSSIHCSRCSDDYICYFIAADYHRCSYSGTEGKRPFHIISHLVTSQPSGTCIGKPVLLLHVDHRLTL
jgi:hypothetical protein